MAEIEVRPVPESVTRLQQQGISPLLARIFAARGVQDGAELETRLNRLVPFQQLRNIEPMARRLADAIAAQQTLTVIADYDADGATACACAVRGLRAMGAQVNYLVPNRFEYGYGLTPEIVDLALRVCQPTPQLLLTVDNGIASVEGVEHAHRLGLEVLITDHHLPGEQVPDTLIVNPNQTGCSFPSKHLAGVGVMFYVLMALRAELRQRGAFTTQPEPNLAQWLDLVALGTVADVVRLDANNRILVQQGLLRMRQGQCAEGIRALFEVSGRQLGRASAFDLGFTLGPRLNAAGRLDDMSVGIECLLTDDRQRAQQLAQQLDELNRERRQIEGGMQQEALATLPDSLDDSRYSVAMFRDDWHQGVVGIVAARLRERFHRPCFVFAPADVDQIKGSGRSIPGFHLRDAVDWIAKRHPDLIQRFGGHAMAAGVALREQDFPRFAAAFEEVAQLWLDEHHLTRRIETDGALLAQEMTLQQAEELDSLIWGQGFPPPLFSGEFTVLEQRVVAEKHRKLSLGYAGQTWDAIFFNYPDPLPNAIQAVYQLQVNEFRGQRRVQLLLQHATPV